MVVTDELLQWDISHSQFKSAKRESSKNHNWLLVSLHGLISHPFLYWLRAPAVNYFQSPDLLGESYLHEWTVGCVPMCDFSLRLVVSFNQRLTECFRSQLSFFFLAKTEAKWITSVWHSSCSLSYSLGWNVSDSTLVPHEKCFKAQPTWSHLISWKLVAHPRLTPRHFADTLSQLDDDYCDGWASWWGWRGRGDFFLIPALSAETVGPCT